MPLNFTTKSNTLKESTKRNLIRKKTNTKIEKTKAFSINENKYYYLASATGRTTEL